MCSLREETGWAFPCWHPPSGCGRDGATISLTGNCNTFPIQLIFTVCLSLFSFQNLHSTLRAFCRTGLGHFSCNFSVFASILLCSLFACKSPWMQLAMALQPAQPLGTGCRTVFKMVTWHLMSHESSWDHKHFWDPQAAACDLQVPWGPWQAVLLMELHSPYL